jgi:hypothetical protein
MIWLLLSGGGVVEKIVDVLSVKDNRKFEVHCNAGDVGELRVGTESISITVGQRILAFLCHAP